MVNKKKNRVNLRDWYKCGSAELFRVAVYRENGGQQEMAQKDELIIFLLFCPVHL